MSLSQEERKAVVDYRLEKAESTFVGKECATSLLNPALRIEDSKIAYASKK